MIHRHINLCENCTFVPILTHWHKTRRLQHTSRDLDTEYKKFKHILRHDEKVHEEKVSKPPPGSSDAVQGVARGPCGGAQFGETMRAGRKPNGTDRAAGRTCSAQRRSWPVVMDRTHIELASCAHKRGAGGACKGTQLFGRFELEFEGGDHLSGTRSSSCSLQSLGRRSHLKTRSPTRPWS